MAEDSPSLVARALRRIGRRLEPLFAPHAAGDRQRTERLLTLARESDASLRRLDDEVAAERAELRKMRESRAADLAETRSALAELRTGVRRTGAATARLAHASGLQSRLMWDEQRVRERLARAARSGRPIVVGPWTGEIGFELLYWIPFVRWAVGKFGLPPERVTVVSRGGTESWYEGIASRYVDAFSLATPDEFRGATEDVKKQRGMRQFDRRLLRRVQQQMGGEPLSLVHPALMYALFMPFWKHQAALPRVLDHTEYRKIIHASRVSLPSLPRDYIAVRFYFSSCLPETADNRSFVASIVASLAEHTDVVMLNPGFRMDDHIDYAAPARSRIHYVDMSSRPQENLAVQTAIIANARSYVGTYGGFAYLAPFCGTNALAFYSDRTYFVYHLELAQRAFGAVGGGALEAIDVHSADALRVALAGARTASAR